MRAVWLEKMQQVRDHVWKILIKDIQRRGICKLQIHI